MSARRDAIDVPACESETVGPECDGGGFGGARRQQNGPIQGDDLRADLELDFKTACFGGQEKGGQRQQYRQTHRAMVKAAEAAGKRAPPAKPPPSEERRRARRREAPTRRNGGQQRVLPRLSGARSASPDTAAIAHRRQAEKLYRNEGRLRPLTPLVVTLNKPLSVRGTHF